MRTFIDSQESFEEYTKQFSFTFTLYVSDIDTNLVYVIKKVCYGGCAGRRYVGLLEIILS